MSKLVIVGCSASSGMGFDPNNINQDCPSSPDLWINLLYNNLPSLHQQYELVNLAKGGASNAEIFEQAVDAISRIISDETSELWCQWTSLSRIKFDAGFELYTTSTMITLPSPLEIRTNQFVLTKKYLKNFFHELKSIMHPHREICKILEYVNIINRLCENQKIKVRHINGLCPWDKNYFIRLSGPEVKPNDYTNYTKEKILFVDDRDDYEIFQLYNKLHNEYEPSLKGQTHTWMNLDKSLYSMRVLGDFNYDNLHPGAVSNQKFAKFIAEILNSK